MPTSQLTRFLTSRLKPHRTEAIARIRFNTLSLLVLLLLTSTVPGLPSLPTAIGVVVARRAGMFWGAASSSRSPGPATTRGKSGKGGGNKWNGGGSNVAKRWDYAVDVYPPPLPSESSSSDNAYAYLCLFITSLTAIFLFNIFESFYALKYPRTQTTMTLTGTPNPLGASSPAQKKRGKLFDGVRIWGGGSSTSNPQPQKPFSFSSSLSSSLSSSHPPSSYPLSPLSTPSRSMHYTPLSTSRSSLASSSSSSVMYTPSPPNAAAGGLSASAYRGRAFGGSVARPLDGSYLGRIVKTEPDSDDEL